MTRLLLFLSDWQNSYHGDRHTAQIKTTKKRISADISECFGRFLSGSSPSTAHCIVGKLRPEPGESVRWHSLAGVQSEVRGPWRAPQQEQEQVSVWLWGVFSWLVWFRGSNLSCTKLRQPCRDKPTPHQLHVERKKKSEISKLAKI